MGLDVDITQAKLIVSSLAMQRARWGKHAGFPPDYSQEQVLDALVDLHESGVLDIDVDIDELRSDVTTANRQKGAAEARATKFKKQLDNANARIKELTIALEDQTTLTDQLNTDLLTTRAKLRIYEKGQDDGNESESI